MGEWIDALNIQPTLCRVLLTSRPWPQGTRDYPPTCLQEYSVQGLGTMEGTALLRQQGVEVSQGTDAELRQAVARAAGHALSLTLLASILRRNRSLNMSLLFNDPIYAPLWTRNIARGLLDYIYTSQLSEVQRKLLLAFSVYREPAALDAAQAIVPDAPKAQILPTLTVLLNQHLLNAVGGGLYQLHAIVNSYAQEHFDESSEEANEAAVLAAHARAAQYYLQRAAKMCPPREKRRAIRDVQPLIEAVWQYCRAEQWQEAYDLMENESIFIDVERWGGNAILLELFQLLLSDQWQPEPAQSADIYDCLGRLYNTLGKRSEALAYYEQALSIGREVGDRYGEGMTLWNIGAFYFEQVRYAAALACLLLARSIFEEVQSPNYDGVQGWIDDLREKVGKRKFAALLAEVEPRALQSVEEALEEGL